MNPYEFPPESLSLLRLPISPYPLEQQFYNKKRLINPGIKYFICELLHFDYLSPKVIVLRKLFRRLSRCHAVYTVLFTVTSDIFKFHVALFVVRTTKLGVAGFEPANARVKF